MALVDLLKKTLPLVALLGTTTAFGVGCASNVGDEPDAVMEDDEVGATTDPVTEVTHTKVKRQSIGNCWLYATASWMEALHKAQTGEELNVSESYLTYWDWFDKIANGAVTEGEISTGGTYATAAELVNRYGWMREADFLPAEAELDMSYAQSKAESAINASLSTGALKDRAARRDRALVRAELDKAFGVSAEVSAQLDVVFGKGVTKTIDRSYKSRRLPSTVKVARARDMAVQLKSPTTGKLEKKTLQDAIGARGSYWGERTGKYAWNDVDYPTTATSRRAFLKRVQRALHDGQPVIISWFVDFNALTSDAKFSKDALDKLGPGRQGGHMTVLHDYEVTDVPGFGTLKAGAKETRPEALEAALSDGAKISFLRIKNSWGAYRPDRWAEAVIPGYHDLMAPYLDGPVKKCAETASGGTDKTRCSSHTPLWDVVLPPGY
ncbi:MAG: hypothetical protein IT374_18650 [Polyangiaceae bacterium]|nr:hypothetical protein [Polyangiaceae bacterium]